MTRLTVVISGEDGTVHESFTLEDPDSPDDASEIDLAAKVRDVLETLYDVDGD